MIIEINKDYKIEVKEDYLIVKDRKLYNTKTKSFMGIEGDIVSFSYDKNGIKGGFRGYVDGYTNGTTVKIRGIGEVYTVTGEMKIEHISSITGSEDGLDLDKELELATSAL